MLASKSDGLNNRPTVRTCTRHHNWRGESEPCSPQQPHHSLLQIQSPFTRRPCFPVNPITQCRFIYSASHIRILQLPTLRLSSFHFHASPSNPPQWPYFNLPSQNLRLSSCSHLRATTPFPCYQIGFLFRAVYGFSSCVVVL